MREHCDVDHQILSNGTTVWVNAADGSCVGRFSKVAVDVHTTATAQQQTGKECLDCVHGLPPVQAWERFVASMLKYHAVCVGDEHMPDFVRASKSDGQ